MSENIFFEQIEIKQREQKPGEKGLAIHSFPLKVQIYLCSVIYLLMWLNLSERYRIWT